MRELWAHQREAVEYALRARRCFIAIDMGGGKSAIALRVINAESAFPAIIACPSVVKPKWGREIEEWLPGTPYQIVNAGDELDPTVQIYVVNYELLDRRIKKKKLKMGEVESETTREKRLASQKLLPRFEDWLRVRPKAFVADESTYLKTKAAQRSKAANKISKSAWIRLALTGTPIDNGPEDYIAQLDFLDRLPDFGGGWAFKKRYCVKAHHTGDIRTCKQPTCAAPLKWKKRDSCPGCPGWLMCDCGKGVWGYWEFGGAENLLELHARLSSNCYFRKTKEQVQKHLPEFRREVVPLQIEREAYEEAERDFIGWVARQKGDEAAQRAFRAEAIVRMEGLRGLAASLKAERAAEWLAGLLEAGEPVVAFVVHKAVSKALAGSLSLWNPRVIDGETHPGQREQTIAQFQAGKIPLLIVNISTLRFGVELTAAANCAFLELDWIPTSHEQAEARLHRSGQARPVTAWYLLAERTIDETIFGVLERKRVAIRGAVDGIEGGGVPFDVEMEVARGLAQGVSEVLEPGQEAVGESR